MRLRKSPLKIVIVRRSY